MKKTGHKAAKKGPLFYGYGRQWKYWLKGAKRLQTRTINHVNEIK